MTLNLSTKRKPGLGLGLPSWPVSAGELRRAGVSVTLGDEIDAATSLAHVDIGDRNEVRLGLRTSLKVEYRAWGVFDDIFDRFWRPGGPSPKRDDGPRRRRQRAPRSWPGQDNPLTSLARRLAEEHGAGPAQEVPDPDSGRPGYSPRALLRTKSFEACTEEELVEMERLLARRWCASSPRGGPASWYRRSAVPSSTCAAASGAPSSVEAS